MFPVIEKLSVKARFKYLWLKYINGANLNVHCAKCLVGEYSTKIQHTTKEANYVELNESSCKYFYLCGVSLPYKWKDNFHLAFKFSKGKKISIERNGIFILIRNAEEITISPIDSTNEHPKRFDHSYSTCRNWQFANMIAKELNAKNSK